MGGLVSAMEKFAVREGCIITYSQEEELTVNKKKIRIIPAHKWLLS